VGNSVLIIGIGNEFRGDDAAGILLARHLREHLSGGVPVLEHSGEGASLMELFAEHGRILVLDAVKADLVPGTVVCLNAVRDRVPANFFHYSTHDFGLAEAVELARRLNRLPEALTIFGIVGRQFGFGDPVSAEVSRVFPRVVQQALRVLKNWGVDISDSEQGG